MNDQESTSSDFNDPNFRGAVCRAWAGEAAPPALRARVLASLAAARDAEVSGAPGSPAAPPGDAAVAGKIAGATTAAPPGPRSSRWRSPLFSLAAAAAVLLVVGLAALQVPNMLTAGSGTPPVLAAGLPDAVVRALVRRHDECANAAEHHLVPGDTPAGARGRLAGDLKLNVAAADLASAGWIFSGAGECVVSPAAGSAPARSAHFLYAHGNDHLSVITLPAGTVPDGVAVTMTSPTPGRHAVSGVVRGRALYCFVETTGDGSEPDLPALARLVLAQLPADSFADAGTRGSGLAVTW